MRADAGVLHIHTIIAALTARGKTFPHPVEHIICEHKEPSL